MLIGIQTPLIPKYGQGTRNEGAVNVPVDAKMFLHVDHIFCSLTKPYKSARSTNAYW